MSGDPLRVQVANQIRADNSDLDVHAWGYVPSNVSSKKLVVAVFMTDMEPSANTLKVRQNLTVNVYGSKTTGEAMEDELDGVRDQVLLSLQRMDHWRWSQASRTTWKDSITGWQITGYMEPNNTYASTVRAERSAE